MGTNFGGPFIAGIADMIVHQIALAIGVLTSNRGVGYQLWRGSRWVPLLDAIGCHCWVPPCRGAMGCHGLPFLGAIAGVPLLAIAGCHCWGAIAGVPLLGAAMQGAAGCHCWGAIAGVPLLGATMQGAAGCHCSVPLLALLGAIAGC